MSNAEQASEPSMEDILSSIRKIIAEEPGGAEAPTGAISAATDTGEAADGAVAEPVSNVLQVAPDGSAQDGSVKNLANSVAGDRFDLPSAAAARKEPVATGAEPSEAEINAALGMMTGSADVPGPVLEAAEDDAAEDEDGQLDDVPAVGDDGPGDGGPGDGGMSAFEALLAASTAPAVASPPPLSATEVGTDARQPAVAKSVTPPAAATNAPALSIPLPNVKNIGMSVAPASGEVCEPAGDGLDDLISLLDDDPVHLPEADDAGGAGSSVVSDSSPVDDAADVTDAAEQPSQVMATAQPDVVAPKPAESLGPLLSRIDAGSQSAGAGERDEMAITAAAAESGEGQDSDTAPDTEDHDEDEAAQPFSKLLQNLGASPQSPSQLDATVATDDAGGGGAGGDAGADIDADGAAAATAALGALAAGIALSDKGTADDTGKSAESADQPAAAEPASEIANLGALLASTPGSLSTEPVRVDSGEGGRIVDADASASAFGVDGSASASASATETATTDSSDNSDDLPIADAAPASAEREASAMPEPQPPVMPEPPSAAPEVSVAAAEEMQQAGTQLVAPATPGDLAPAGDVKTMEDTVSELLRPMLRNWLDSHMPRIVEKALKVELASAIDADAGDGNGNGADGDK